jgi:hypothetical protein
VVKRVAAVDEIDLPIAVVVGQKSGYDPSDVRPNREREGACSGSDVGARLADAQVR